MFARTQLGEEQSSANNLHPQCLQVLAAGRKCVDKNQVIVDHHQTDMNQMIRFIHVIRLYVDKDNVLITGR